MFGWLRHTWRDAFDLAYRYDRYEQELAGDELARYDAALGGERQSASNQLQRGMTVFGMGDTDADD